MICPKCGVKNPEGETFCSQCGARLIVSVAASPTVVTASVVKSGMSNKTFYGLTTAMAIVGVIAIVFILMTSGPQEATQNQTASQNRAPNTPPLIPPTSIPNQGQTTGQQNTGSQDTGSQYSRQEPTGQTMSVDEALETDLPVICTGGSKKHYLKGWKYALENLGGGYFEVKYDGTSEYTHNGPNAPWVYVESAVGSDRLEDAASGAGITCQVVNDIPDALFRLPPGSDIAD